MIEFLKHLTGACGEPHMSLLTILASTPLIGYVVYQIRNLWKQKFNVRLTLDLQLAIDN